MRWAWVVQRARLGQARQSARANFTMITARGTRGRLFVSAGTSQLTVKAGHDLTALYQARFEGTMPEVRVAGGEVNIRYARRLRLLGAAHSTEVTLNSTIPWRIALQAHASEFAATIGELDLAELEVKGHGSAIHLELPMPSAAVPIRIGGAGSAIIVNRPAGVAVRVRVRGWTSMGTLDGESAYGAGGSIRLQTPDFDMADQRYDIEATGTGSMVTVTGV